jgi:hypothetical protein
MNDPADVVRRHAAVVRRHTEAVLGFPNLAAADRSELLNVVREVDAAARIFGPEAGSPACVALFVQRMDTLIQRVHSVASKYTKQAS